MAAFLNTNLILVFGGILVNQSSNTKGGTYWFYFFFSRHIVLGKKSILYYIWLKNVFYFWHHFESCRIKVKGRHDTNIFSKIFDISHSPQYLYLKKRLDWKHHSCHHLELRNRSQINVCDKSIAFWKFPRVKVFQLSVR